MTVGVRRENDETAQNCRIIKSNELLSNYYSRRQNLRRKDIFKIYLSLYKDPSFLSIKTSGYVTKISVRNRELC